MTKRTILLKERDQLYSELTATFTHDDQWRLLDELVETEIELKITL